MSLVSFAVALGWLWKNRPSPLKSFDDTRRFAVNFLLATTIALLIFVIAEATFDKSPLVEPISVPKPLEEVGYTGTVIAQRLIDEIHVVGKQAKTSKNRVLFKDESRVDSLASLQLPSSSFSVRSVVSMMRSALGIRDNKIGGEITIVPGEDRKV